MWHSELGGRGRGRSNTPNAWRNIAKKVTHSSSNAFKALANEEFFNEIASVASTTQATFLAKKEVRNSQASSSQKNF